MTRNVVWWKQRTPTSHRERSGDGGNALARIMYGFSVFSASLRVHALRSIIPHAYQFQPAFHNYSVQVESFRQG